MSFGRPKTYPHIHDMNSMAMDPRADHNVVASLEENASPAMREWLVEHRKGLLTGAQRFFVRQQAQFTDPRCLYHVLDAIIQSSPGTYVRPRYVAAWLNNAQHQYLWPGGTVGRLLAGVAEQARMVYGVGNDEGVEYEENERYLPFAGARDGVGQYYVIDPLGGNEGRLWLMTLRARMRDLSEEQSQADNRGERRLHFASTLNAADAVMGWCGDCGPVRSLAAYEAQTLDPDDPSLDVMPARSYEEVYSNPADVRIGG